MHNAKYYIYRNLHKNKFSIKFRGKVINRHGYIITMDSTFKVNEKGRQRVLLERRKNVHAFVACKAFMLCGGELDITNLQEVYYNPYKLNTFVLKATNDIITSNKKVYLWDNKIYIDKEI